ncbi:hypothetical protein SOVF_026070 [Spinacia oleracea]|nr:hypothetical protein SOVF_026070 [Spinacia oleracea]
MAASGKKVLAMSGNGENGDDPISNTHFSFGQLLDLGVINQYGQLLGEYSRLDEELWLSEPEPDDVVDNLDRSDDGVNHFATSPSEFVDKTVCDGGMATVKEKLTSLKDCSQNLSSPISVFQTKSSYSDDITTICSQSKCLPPTKHKFSGSLQFLGTTMSTREQRCGLQSESEYSMESLSDENEESIPSKSVRTRKISDLLDLDYDPAIKKCMHCETTDTPQWRTGPLGRGTLCNACGVQYKQGRLFSVYRPLRSPAFDPSLHSNLPKKVHEMRKGSSNEGDPNPPTPKPKKKKVEEMRMSNKSERDPSPTPKPKKVVPTPELKKVEEMRMGNYSEMARNLSFEQRKAEEMKKGNNSDMARDLSFEQRKADEMILGNENERYQNRAHRAKKFEEMREKASNVVQSDSRKRNREFDSYPTVKRKLARKVAKKCLHCESTETPQWREGPMGRKTLCNACGVQYKAGRLFPEYRPLKSPTYNPSLHSHLPKKVLKMRMSSSENCATSGNHEKPA